MVSVAAAVGQLLLRRPNERKRSGATRKKSVLLLFPLLLLVLSSLSSVSGTREADADAVVLGGERAGAAPAGAGERGLGSLFGWAIRNSDPKALSEQSRDIETESERQERLAALKERAAELEAALSSSDDNRLSLRDAMRLSLSRAGDKSKSSSERAAAWERVSELSASREGADSLVAALRVGDKEEKKNDGNDATAAALALEASLSSSDAEERSSAAVALSIACRNNQDAQRALRASTPRAVAVLSASAAADAERAFDGSSSSSAAVAARRAQRALSALSALCLGPASDEDDPCEGVDAAGLAADVVKRSAAGAEGPSSAFLSRLLSSLPTRRATSFSSPDSARKRLATRATALLGDLVRQRQQATRRAAALSSSDDALLGDGALFSSLARTVVDGTKGGDHEGESLASAAVDALSALVSRATSHGKELGSAPSSVGAVSAAAERRARDLSERRSERNEGFDDDDLRHALDATERLVRLLEGQRRATERRDEL